MDGPESSFISRLNVETSVPLFTPKHYARVCSLPPHPHQHVRSFVFLMAILTKVIILFGSREMRDTWLVWLGGALEKQPYLYGNLSKQLVWTVG